MAVSLAVLVCAKILHRIYFIFCANFASHYCLLTADFVMLMFQLQCVVPLVYNPAHPQDIICCERSLGAIHEILRYIFINEQLFVLSFKRCTQNESTALQINLQFESDSY